MAPRIIIGILIAVDVIIALLYIKDGEISRAGYWMSAAFISYFATW